MKKKKKILLDLLQQTNCDWLTERGSTLTTNTVPVGKIIRWQCAQSGEFSATHTYPNSIEKWQCVKSFRENGIFE